MKRPTPATVLRRTAGVPAVAALGLVLGTTVLASQAKAAPISHRITLDARRAGLELNYVTHQIQRSCRIDHHVIVNNVRSVTVRVRSRVGNWATTFACVKVRDDLDAIERQLVAAAAPHNHAKAKARRLLTIQHRLLRFAPDLRPVPDTSGLTYGPRDLLVWSFSTGDPLTCQRAGRPREIREMMAEGARVNHETPEHWTLIEAVMLAGACPDRLPVLFRNVSKIGEPEAATAVKRLLEQAS